MEQLKSIIRFSVDGRAQTKGSTKAFIPKGWNRAVITNDNPKTKIWETIVRLSAKDHVPVTGPWSGPIELNVVFRLRKPKSHPKKRKLFHTKKPDLDKLMRSVTDALTGLFYEDDRQVCAGYRRKEYSDNPGADIEVINIQMLKEEVGA